MSGQLAAWVSRHGKGDKAVVDVVRELALASKPDGTSVYAPTWDELAQGTRTARSTVAAALKTARDLGAISVDQPGRGRGRATVYRVHYRLCEPLGACPVCSTLAASLPEKVQQPDVIGPAPSPRKGPAAGPNRPGKGPAQARKGPTDALKGPAPGPTTDTGTDHPQGGTYPHPESNDRAPLRSAASGSAARSAPKQQPAPAPEPPPGGNGDVPGWEPSANGHEPPPDAPALTSPPTPSGEPPAGNERTGLPSEQTRTALYGALGKRPPPRDRLVDGGPLTAGEQARQQWAEWRERNPQPPFLLAALGSPGEPGSPADPERAEAVTGPEPPASAAELPPAAAGGPAPEPPGGWPEVVPVNDPIEVVYPQDVGGSPLGPCVVCHNGCTSVHAVSGQLRHPFCHDPPRQEGTAA